MGGGQYFRIILSIVLLVMNVPIKISIRLELNFSFIAHIFSQCSEQEN